jgi:hypothetical protein
VDGTELYFLHTVARHRKTPRNKGTEEERAQFQIGMQLLKLGRGFLISYRIIISYVEKKLLRKILVAQYFQVNSPHPHRP